MPPEDDDPADYPTDRDDDDEEEKDPSRDKADDEEVDEDDEEEEEEHLAPADSVPPPVHRVMARISIRPQTPISSPLLPVSPPPPASPTYPLGYRAAIIRLRAKAPSTSHSLLLPPPIILSCTRSDAPPSGTPPILPIPLPTSSPSLLLPSTDHGADSPEVCLPPRKRLCFAFGPRYEVRESSSALATRPIGGFRADYGFIATLDREIRRDPKREDTYEIYVRLGEAQDKRSLMSGRLNLIKRDRRARAHAHTTLLMESEARLSCEDWGQSMDASDLARSKVMALRTQVTTLQGQFGPASGPAQLEMSEEADSSS
ncbi:hypothetical protein Tco_1120587 [Tanacetum coccineum]